MFRVYYFIYNTENFFHFIYDTLPYLYCYLEMRKENPEMKLMMNYVSDKKHNFYPFVIEALKVLEISKDDIIVHNKNNMYKKEVLVPSITYVASFSGYTVPQVQCR